ncbi:MAG: hypothetical protein IJ880_01405 [Bacilli bacterium]|nr:hypothetical protein [Bacilli bacterium]
MNNTDGWVTIGFKGDTKQLEKDIQTEERRLKQFEKESEKLTQQKAKLQIDLEDYEKQKQLIEETTKQNMMFASTEKGKKRIFAEENESMTSLNQKYSKQINQLNEIEDKLQRNAYQQGLINNNISEMNRELRQSKGLENIKNSMEGIIKKVKRWALAIFGVRSAYMFVRQAMSTLSESDEQLATNIEYIKWALATTIKPIIEWIVKAVYTVLS